MRRTLLSAWAWFAIVTLILAWFPTLVVVWLLDRDPAHYHTGRWFRRLGASLTYVNPFWDIRVEGTPPEDPRLPYVVVGNHLSIGDPPIVSRLPWEMKWVGKKSLFELPLAGWMMRMAGDIAVDRRDKRSRAAVLTKARAVLDRRCSVMLFPEGTRSKDGRVRAFAHGAFRLAIRAGVPVLPIAIDGTQDALPKHTWRFSDMDGPMRVKVLPPVSTDGLTASDAPELAETVRRCIIEQLARWRDADPAEIDGATQRSRAEGRGTSRGLEDAR